MSAIALVLMLLLPAAAAAQDPAPRPAGPPRVLAVQFDHAVNPVTQELVVDAIARAEDEGYAAVVVLLDTPGGLDSSMREIVQAQLSARVPVIVYVAPDGARAASAGVFLMMAADVAAMAPQTNLGSSTPISVQGGELPEDARRKAINDAAAYLRALAEEHGRDGDWAELAVREGANLTARDAARRNVVDAVAPDLATLLERIDGTRTEPKGLVLETAGARVEYVELSTWRSILNVLIDPNLIVILLSVGVLGIIIEVASPGLVVPGTLGALSLVLALFGLQALPLGWAGIALMALAAGLFAAEAFAPGVGVFAACGAVAFAAGALLLFDPAGDDFAVSAWVAVGVGAALAALATLAVVKAGQANRPASRTGGRELIGEVGVVREALAPTGAVFVRGELWRAHAPGPALAPGTRVEVLDLRHDLVLEVAERTATDSDKETL